MNARMHSPYAKVEAVECFAGVHGVQGGVQGKGLIVKTLKHHFSQLDPNSWVSKGLGFRVHITCKFETSVLNKCPSLDLDHVFPRTETCSLS